MSSGGRVAGSLIAACGALVLTRAAAAAGSPVFVPRPCAAQSANARLTCGTVDVPENRASGAGRAILLNVVVVRATGDRPGAAPLFHLDGGPGIAATPVAGFYLGPGAVYAASRDVVLIDQRGTGASAPLHCLRIEQRAPWDDEYTAADVEECRHALEQHTDLRQYSTEQAAQDIDSVRQALGYEKIDIWALSYGTRLAQVYLKRFPDRVHAAVLVGFAPLDYRAPLYHAVNAQRVLDLLFYQCQRDESCSEKYPRLRNEWQAVLKRLDDGPMPVTTKSGPASLARGRFTELFRSLLTTAAGQRSVLALIHAAANGDFAAFLDRAGGAGPRVAEGAYLAIVCSEAVPRIPGDASRFTAGTFLADYRVRQEEMACARWTRYDVPPSFYDAPRSPVPILVISGTMDSVTTPDWAEEFCMTTPGCRLASIPDLGHGPFDLGEWSEGECLDRVAAAFLEHPGDIDTACLARMRPPAFK